MMQQHKIMETSSKELEAAIKNIFESYNLEQDVTPYDKKSLAIELRDGDQIIGGLEGYSAWSWLNIKTIAIQKEYRGGGHGLKLLELAEEEARKRGCIGIYLSTMSFQAPEFYKKAGFKEYGHVNDNPKGHSRILFKKELR